MKVKSITVKDFGQFAEDLFGPGLYRGVALLSYSIYEVDVVGRVEFNYDASTDEMVFLDGQDVIIDDSVAFKVEELLRMMLDL